MTGGEPFIEPVAGGLVGIVFDVAKKVGGGFAQAVGDRRQAARALKRYEERYLARYGTLKLLGMQQPLELETVYTRVRFLDELSIRRFASLDALEQTYRQGQKRRFQRREITNLDSFTVANENQYLMVLGGPGAGKSTYLRRIGLEALKGESGAYVNQCIPVMIELKRFNSNSVNLTEAIADELSNFGFPLSPEFAINALERGKLLVLFDGLDEVPKAYSNIVIDSIQNFVTKYDRNFYIASCRIAAHRSALTHFRDIELSDFDDSQIQRFIQNWFSSRRDRENKTAEHCWEILNEISNAAAKELAQTPLLLTFLCLVYDRTQSFPTNRATLYRKALDILLEEWAAEKRIIPGEIYQGLNTDLEKVLLSEIAYNNFVSDQLFFTQQELVDQIKSFLSDTVDKPKYIDGKAVLDSIATQQGILVERAEDIYSFSHLTLQEYLTAQYISQESELIIELVSRHLIDRRWREIFLLVAGIVRSADKLLELMFLGIEESINQKKIKEIFYWADKITSNTRSNYKKVAKRAAAVFLFRSLVRDYNRDIMLVRSRDLAHDFISSYDLDSTLKHSFNIAQAFGLNLNFNESIDIIHPQDISRIGLVITEPEFNSTFDLINAYNLSMSSKLANELKSEKILAHTVLSSLILQLRKLKSDIPRRNQPSEIHQQFIGKIYKTWFDSLHIKRDWLTLSEQELETLGSYLYVIEIIVRCKDSAVRVSEKVWQKIETKMLTAEYRILR